MPRNSEIVLPDTSTLSLGHTYTFLNKSVFAADIIDTENNFVAPLFGRGKTTLILVDKENSVWNSEYTRPNINIDYIDSITVRPGTVTDHSGSSYTVATQYICCDLMQIWNDIVYVPVYQSSSWSSNSKYTTFGILKVYDLSSNTTLNTLLRVYTTSGKSTYNIISSHIRNGILYLYTDYSTNIYTVDIENWTVGDTLTPNVISSINQEVIDKMISEEGFWLTACIITPTFIGSDTTSNSIWYDPETNNSYSISGRPYIKNLIAASSTGYSVLTSSGSTRISNISKNFLSKRMMVGNRSASSKFTVSFGDSDIYIYPYDMVNKVGYINKDYQYTFLENSVLDSYTKVEAVTGSGTGSISNAPINLMYNTLCSNARWTPSNVNSKAFNSIEYFSDGSCIVGSTIQSTLATLYRYKAV